MSLCKDVCSTPKPTFTTHAHAWWLRLRTNTRCLGAWSLNQQAVTVYNYFQVFFKCCVAECFWTVESNADGWRWTKGEDWEDHWSWKGECIIQVVT